jgi:hypothetical protein
MVMRAKIGDGSGGVEKWRELMVRGTWLRLQRPMAGGLLAGLALTTLALSAWAQGPAQEPTSSAVPPAAVPAPPAPLQPATQPAAADQAPVATASPDQPPATTPAAPPPPVQVQALSPLDMFSAGRDTGLGPDLWKGASADLARAVIPTLADHPLSPAGAALAHRVLAAAANAPDGAGADADLAAARARALLGLGDAAGAELILDHTPSLANNASLSEAAAEAALIDDNDDKACAIGDGLAVGRDDSYWLRLRAFCQARAGTPAAQLTFTLADRAAKDAVFARMMTVIIAGAGDPGPAVLNNGLDYAMSQRLKLDLAPAMADAAPAIVAHLAAANAGLGPAQPPAILPVEADLLAALRQAKSPVAYAVAAKAALPSIAALVQAKAPLANPVQLAAAALAAGDLDTAQAIRVGLTADSVPGAGPTDLAILDAALAVSAGHADGPSLDRLIERGGGSEPKEAARAQAAAAIALALGWPADGSSRAQFAAFGLGRSDASPARLLLLDASADARVRGDTALIALSIAEAGGEAGPAPADRARLIRTLGHVGFAADAQAFAVEGLLSLESR